MIRKCLREAATIVAIVALSTTIAMPASAEPSSEPIRETLARAPESILDAAVPLEIDSVVGEVSSEDKSVVVREDEAGLVDIDLSRHDIGIKLPVEHSGMRDNPGNPELVSWEDGGGVVYAPLVSPEGDVQINIVIPDSTAPREYAFELNIPDYSELEEVNGSYFFLGPTGNVIAGIAPAWARDANGKPVPTHFEIHGKTVVQVIDYSNTSSFPVVADPYLGKRLFKSIGAKYGKYYGVNTNVVTLQLSTWGWAVYTGSGSGIGGVIAGQGILNTNGWKEALAKGGRVKSLLLSKKSMRQQFSCHALGALGAGTWELETFRPNRTRHWTYGVAKHRCNWTTPNSL
ncbi:hypothetical protein [Brachybacterium sp. UMB0905]|uniref:hypothetical protein n=1 Tax=Brachybacterium sp. UMB0905 TaxID=2069310 RepID=UPI0011AFB72F|nr:hypothetical protein [Brachybacterium sp. UMB0905]